MQKDPQLDHPDLLQIIPATVTDQHTHSASLPTYCRSNFATCISQQNPLLQASTPLISTICRLTHLDESPSKQIQHLIQHETLAFEHQCRQQGYSPTIASSAKFILSAWAHDVLQYNGNWPSALPTCDIEAMEEDPLDKLANHCLTAQDQYIDLIEILYLCLKLGYIGRASQKDTAKQERWQLCQHLYQAIQNKRQPNPNAHFKLYPRQAAPQNIFKLQASRWLTLLILGLTIYTAHIAWYKTHFIPSISSTLQAS
jgi:type VI protein secretion system component VasF